MLAWVHAVMLLGCHLQNLGNIVRPVKGMQSRVRAV